MQTNFWNRHERTLIDSLILDNLEPVTDASNQFFGSAAAIELGAALFNDPGLSASGELSCASCHKPGYGYADKQRSSRGSQPAGRHTPALLGIKYASRFDREGRRATLWSRTLSSIESAREMGNSRLDAVRFVANHPDYGPRLQALAPKDSRVLDQLAALSRFPAGASPIGDGKRLWQRLTDADQRGINRIYATIGKVIAAWEATLEYSPARFDEWAKQLRSSKPQSPGDITFSAAEKAGLRLFLDLPRTRCMRCHNGPLFSIHSVQKTATAGRTSVHDDLSLAHKQTTEVAFKVPSLRNLSATAPYFHDGRYDSLIDVVDHYRNRQAPQHSREVPAIKLSDEERDQLVAFLLTL